ncbi:MAG: hypothetical protein E7358_04250 [Clostridiales bacterium]|nr:hypothetical protein [Clostridiales bacterium]
MLYIITLIAFISIYIALIFLMKYFTNVKLTNAIFTASVFIPYIMLVVTIYRNTGFYDWNFQNTLPVANVSPFMFTVVPLSLILPKKIKKHFLLLISLLSVGMFLSGALGCVYNAVIKYKFHIHFTYDFFAHFALSLYGVYIVKSKQVDLSRSNALISSLIIFAVATLMLILNVIFDTAFFGLSLNGKHNIYLMVLVDSSYLSALIYYLGLCLVLVFGYIYSKLLSKKSG